jgi:hypothetical protein
MIAPSGAFFELVVGLQLSYTLASSIIIYFVTTILISIGMGIDLKQSPVEIWKEQYQWMVLYYVGIGFVSYSLIFGYKNADLLGIVFIAVPLMLLRFSQVQYVGHTRDIVQTLRKKNLDLEKSANEIQELNEGLLTTLSEIIDLRDPYVLGHSKQVNMYATEWERIKYQQGRSNLFESRTLTILENWEFPWFCKTVRLTKNMIIKNTPP